MLNSALSFEKWDHLEALRPRPNWIRYTVYNRQDARRRFAHSPSRIRSHAKIKVDDLQKYIQDNPSTDPCKIVLWDNTNEYENNDSDTDVKVEGSLTGEWRGGTYKNYTRKRREVSRLSNLLIQLQNVD
jgi:hypothetical protein